MELTPVDIKMQFDEAAFHALLSPLAAGRLPKLEFETSHQRKDGSEYPVHVNLSRTMFHDRPVCVAFVTDLTERLQLEQQLAQAQKLESIGQLAAGIAHEINTPMQCVVTNVEYLTETCVSLFEISDSYRESLCMPSTSWAERKANFDTLEAKYNYYHLRDNTLDAIVETAEAATRVVEVVRAMKSMAHPGSAEKTCPGRERDDPQCGDGIEEPLEVLFDAGNGTRRNAACRAAPFEPDESSDIKSHCPTLPTR